MHSDPLARLLLELVGATLEGDRCNIAPTESVPVIRALAGAAAAAGRHDAVDPPCELVSMRWWLVPWWSDGPSQKYAMFNARSETARNSRAFKRPFERQRCLFPASSWIEWRTTEQGKLPHQVRPADVDALLIAGLWDVWRKGDAPLLSCAMLTTAAHPALAFLHARMPVLIHRDAIDLWLDPETPVSTLQDLCEPSLPLPLVVEPLCKRVSNARHKDPADMVPVGAGTPVPAD